MKQILRLYTKMDGKLVHFNSEVPDFMPIQAFIREGIAAVKEELPGCFRVLALVPPRLEQIELFPELRVAGQ